jgi:hypothetical protein
MNRILLGKIKEYLDIFRNIVFSNWNLGNKLITLQTCVEAAPLLGYFHSQKSPL